MLGLWWAQLLNNVLAAFNSGVAASTTSFESIATVTVGSGGAANVEFTSIGTDWTHLQIRGILRSNFGSSGWEELKIQFNSDTGSNYAWHYLSGNGSTASAVSGSSASGIRTISCFPSSGVTASVFGVSVIDILDYRNTNKYKTVRFLGGGDANGSGYVGLSSGLWQNTNAITSIKLTNWAGAYDFVQYSHFALYGIKSA